MASGAEIVQTLTADAATNTCGIEARPVGAITPEVYYSAVTSKKIATITTAFERAALASADTTANLAGTNYTSNAFALVDVKNSIHLLLTARTSVASQSATVFLILYAADNTFLGITRDYTFSSDATFRDGASGAYVSSVEIVDVGCATFVFPALRVAPISGTADIYIEAL